MTLLPLQIVVKIHKRKETKRSFTSVQMVHAHARSSEAFSEDASRGLTTYGFHKKSKCAEKCRTREIRSDISMCCHQQDHREFPDSQHGFEPKYLTQWPNE